MRRLSRLLANTNLHLETFHTGRLTAALYLDHRPQAKELLMWAGTQINSHVPQAARLELDSFLGP
jgi:hypothetical protein